MKCFFCFYRTIEKAEPHTFRLNFIFLLKMIMMNLKTKQLVTFISAGSDLEKGIEFYKDMGFELQHMDADIAVLSIDEHKFILQKYPNEWMQGNFMMVLEVEDADAWYDKLAGLQLTQKYEGVFLKKPQDFPWGKRVCHLGDPNGVLWHISADII